MSFIERVGGELIYNLHPGQMQAWDSEARFVFVIAGTQSGKTSFAPLWLYKEIQERGVGDYAAVSANYDLFKLKLLPEMCDFFEPLGWSYAKSDRVLTDGKSRIILRSAEAKAGLESATLKAAILDECGMDCFSLDAWLAVVRRLSLNEGRVFAGTTPYNLGWLKTEIYDRWAAGDKNIEVVQFRSIDNPVFPQAEYDRAKASMPAWKFSMMYNGNFTRPAGMIYNDFPGAVPAFRVPESARVAIGVDFGGTNTACLWVAEIEGRYYVVDEYLDGDKATQGHVRAIKANKHSRVSMRAWGGAPSEKQCRMDWRHAGLNVVRPPVADVEPGIDRVIEAFKTGTLNVFDNCIGLIDELGRYSRELDKHGQPTERIKDKATFHRLDALRYVMSGLKAPFKNTIAVQGIRL